MEASPPRSGTLGFIRTETEGRGLSADSVREQHTADRHAGQHGAAMGNVEGAQFT